MNCNEAKQLLDRTGGTPAACGELAEHLKGCEACRDHARERQLVALLADLPVRQPRPGMEARVMQRALGRHGSAAPVHLRWALATAASVILAVIVTLQFYPATAGRKPAPAGALQPAVVQVTPQQTHMVKVLLTTPRALKDTEITVRLDDNLSLQGYDDVHELKWRASLKRGTNRLSLPVQLLRGGSGKITVTVRHGGGSKHITVNVTAAPEQNAPKISMV